MEHLVFFGSGYLIIGMALFLLLYLENKTGKSLNEFMVTVGKCVLWLPYSVGCFLAFVFD